MSRRRPTVSPELLAHLREVFPLRNPKPGASLEAIQREAGHQDVIEHLASLAADANEATKRFMQGPQGDSEE